MNNSSSAQSSPAANPPSLTRALLIGGVGFCLASLIVFATVAFAERWMYAQFGLAGAYLVWTILFILLGGAVLSPLVVSPRWRLPRFFLLFGAAFFAYAVGWIASYFILRGAAGEWVGSIAGSILMAFVFAAGFGAIRLLGKAAALLFVTNSIGYFLGSWVNDTFGGRPGMLLWGVAYGLFLGAGIGLIIRLLQTERT